MYRNVLLALHIASVAGWLGCNLTQLFLSRWFVRRGGDAAVAWFEATNRLARRYYNVVGVVLGVTGVLLVRNAGYVVGRVRRRRHRSRRHRRLAGCCVLRPTGNGSPPPRSPADGRDWPATS